MYKKSNICLIFSFLTILIVWSSYSIQATPTISPIIYLHTPVSANTSTNVISYISFNVGEIKSSNSSKYLSIELSLSVYDFVSYSIYQNQTLFGFDVINSTSISKNWTLKTEENGVSNITLILFNFNGSNIYQNQILYEIKPFIDNIPTTTDDNFNPINNYFFTLLNVIGLGAVVFVPVKITHSYVQKRRNSISFLHATDSRNNSDFELKGLKNSYFRTIFESQAIPFQIRLNFLLTCSNIVSIQIINNIKCESILQLQLKKHFYDQIPSSNYMDLMKNLYNSPQNKKDRWEIPLKNDNLFVKKWEKAHISVIIIFLEDSFFEETLFNNALNELLNQAIKIIPNAIQDSIIRKDKLMKILQNVLNIELSYPVQDPKNTRIDEKLRNKLWSIAFKSSNLPESTELELKKDFLNLTINEIKTLLDKMQMNRSTDELQQNEITDKDLF